MRLDNDSRTCAQHESIHSRDHSENTPYSQLKDGFDQEQFSLRHLPNEIIREQLLASMSDDRPTHSNFEESLNGEDVKRAI